MRIELIAVAAFVLFSGCRRDEQPQGGHDTLHIRIVRQYGLSYLPLVVMQQRALIEKHCQAAGLVGVKVEWITVSSGAAAADALLSGAADYIATGVTPLITLWSKTDHEVRGVAALDSSPLLLNTTDSAIKSLKDFSPNSRIALPAIRVSIQAVVLEMKAAQEFGLSNYGRLDGLTVSMNHPDALVALLSAGSGITAHLTSTPFTFEELADPRVHVVFNSFDLLGPHTVDVLSTTRRFHDRNPQIAAAILAALEEADSFIARDKTAAAALYIESYHSKESASALTAELNDPSLHYGTTPLNVTKFSDFLRAIGAIKTSPSWKDLFFPEIYNQPGS